MTWLLVASIYINGHFNQMLKVASYRELQSCFGAATEMKSSFSTTGIVVNKDVPRGDEIKIATACLPVNY